MHHAELRWLTPQELTIVPELQRTTSVARARKMAREWNVDYVGVLEAAIMVDAEGDEILHVIDGGHRKEAAIIFGAENGAVVQLPVVVYNDLSRTQIAQLFLARNNMAKKVGAFDNHMIGLQAGDELALLIQRAFDRTKFDISRSASSYSVAAIGNIQTQTTSLRKQSGDQFAEDAIVEVLDLITKAWSKEGAERVQGHVVRALLWLTGEHGIFNGKNKARLVRVLKNHTPKGWRAAAVAAREGDPFSSGSEFKYLAELWVDAFNNQPGDKLAA